MVSISTERCSTPRPKTLNESAEGPGRHAQGEVLLQLAVEPLLDVARGDVFAVLAEEGRVVDREEHRHRGFVDGDGGQRFGILVVADRVADFEAVDAHDGADLAAGNLLDLLLAEALENHQLLDPGFRIVTPSRLARVTIWPALSEPRVDLAHGDTARVGRIFERRDEHLGRAPDDFRLGDLVDDGVEQRNDRVGAARSICATSSPAWPSRRWSCSRAAPRWRRARTSGRKPAR